MKIDKHTPTDAHMHTQRSSYSVSRKAESSLFTRWTGVPTECPTNREAHAQITPSGSRRVALLLR